MVKNIRLNIKDALSCAVSFHLQGKLAEAEILYSKILELQINEPDATHNLALIKVDELNFNKAIQLFEQAIKIKPDSEIYLTSYVNLLLNLNRYESARKLINVALKNGLEVDKLSTECEKRELINNILRAFKEKKWEALEAFASLMTINFPQEPVGWSALGASKSINGLKKDSIFYLQKVVELCPVDVDALNNIALGHQDIEEYSASLKYILQAIKINPDYARTYNTLGLYYRYINNYELAEINFKKSIGLDSNQAEPYDNLANIYCQYGSITNAIDLYSQAIQLQPENPESYNNLGIALLSIGLYSKAEQNFMKAISIRPTYTKAITNLGSCLYYQGKNDEAIQQLNNAIELDPQNADAYSNLGLVLAACNNTSQAMAAHRRAIELNPDRAEIYNNIAGLLKDIGKYKEACNYFKKACELNKKSHVSYSNYLFCSLHDPSLSNEELFERHKEFSHRFETPNKVSQFSEKINVNNKIINIGFVSGDLYHHAVSSFAAPYVTKLNKERFKVFVYSTSSVEDEMTKYYKSNVDSWQNVVGKSDDEICALIRKDNIDILIDLSGHTARNRLLVFGRKPAPVQATWIGYPYTTGMDQIDYYFTDEQLSPPNTFERFWTEKFIYLPNSGLFRPEGKAPVVNKLPALTNNFITFGSFNRIAKINEHVLDSWLEILMLLPNSRLLIANISDDETKVKLIDHFSRVSNRIEFAGRLNLYEYLKLHNKVDIHLDTWPYPGGTTTMHAAWMGVPTLTLNADSLLSNLGAAIMRKFELHQFISSDVSGYIKKAKYFSEHIEELALIRNNLRGIVKKSPACDVELNVHGFEYALLSMWRRWRNGEVPCSFQIKKDVCGEWILPW